MKETRDIEDIIQQLERCPAILYTPVTKDGRVLNEEQDTHILIPQYLHADILSVLKDKWLRYVKKKTSE